MRVAVLASVAIAFASVATAQPAHRHDAAQTKAAIAKALADPARADQAGDDARRQAAAVLAFAGVGPGDGVIDFLPGQGYWTRIFTGVVGPAGHVYAYWRTNPANPAPPKGLTALQALNLANLTAESQPGWPNPPQPVDLFWTVQNYHDLPQAMIGEYNAAVFQALKQGGVYIVIDHADNAGAVRTEPFKHRIDPALVKAQVIAAGFRFVGSSAVLANPADDHSKPVFDPSLRGHTDQFVYKFRKPG